MKPVVIYGVEPYKEDTRKIVILKETFEKLMEDIYQAGLEDGKLVGKQELYYPNNIRDFKPDWTVRPEQNT